MEVEGVRKVAVIRAFVYVIFLLVASSACCYLIKLLFSCIILSSSSFPRKIFLPGFFAHCLNSVFLSAFLSNSFVSFMHFFSASVPEVLMSCPAIEGRRGMLILSPQRHSAGEGEKGGGNVTRLRKLDGHCSVCASVCTYVYVHASQKISMTDISCFSYFYFASIPIEFYMCV